MNFTHKRIATQEYVDRISGKGPLVYKEVISLPKLTDCFEQFSAHYTHMAKLRPTRSADQTQDETAWVDTPGDSLTFYTNEEFAAKFNKKRTF